MIHVHDSLKGKVVPLETREPGRVSMYTCGPTVYNYIHIGNARTFIWFDQIRRYLSYRGFNVTYVMNYTDVDDIEASVREIDVMLEAGCFPVIVALPPDLLTEASELLQREGVAFVMGGETRQESVRNGLDAVTSDRIVIHDGARPFVEEALVHSVLTALDDADAVVPVLPVDDTLKEVDGEVVLRTIDRDRIRRIQTPQAFRSGPLRDAHDKAARENFIATDDAQLVEMSGGRVVTVPGHPSNIKLTRPEDFATAELYGRR